MVKRYGYHHTQLRVRDLEAAIAFYEALGCSVIRRWHTDDILKCMMNIGGNNIIEIFSGGTDTDQVCPKFEHIALRSMDTDADYAAAVAAGARPKEEPKDVVIGDDYPARIAFVYGPDDELIEFFMEQ